VNTKLKDVGKVWIGGPISFSSFLFLFPTLKRRKNEEGEEEEEGKD
jgi:hypothetical protein